MNYSIKEISARLNIPASTLRYYEKRGIIGPLARRAGQVRVFSEEDLKLLQIVQCLKKTGMPIEEIRQFAELIRQGDATLSQRADLFEHHKAQIEHQIEQLQENLAVLERKMKIFSTPSAK